MPQLVTFYDKHIHEHYSVSPNPKNLIKLLIIQKACSFTSTYQWNLKCLQANNISILWHFCVKYNTTNSLSFQSSHQHPSRNIYLYIVENTRLQGLCLLKAQSHIQKMKGITMVWLIYQLSSLSWEQKLPITLWKKNTQPKWKLPIFLCSFQSVSLKHSLNILLLIFSYLCL